MSRTAAAERVAGRPVWRGWLPGASGVVRWGFVGRGRDAVNETPEAILARGEPAAPRLSWARQVHSATVLEALPGCCGEGDALVTGDPHLALSVVTADCVPVLLAVEAPAEGFRVAAVHAGWRGIAAGVVAAAVERLGTAAGTPAAWIGPAIGPCCYEVDEDVARQVAAASSDEAVLPNPTPGGSKPHLDLLEAVRCQLRTAGAAPVGVVDACTRCGKDELASYRRDGHRAGRNLAYIWWEPRG